MKKTLIALILSSFLIQNAFATAASASKKAEKECHNKEDKPGQVSKAIELADELSRKTASVESPKLNDREVKRICIFIKNGEIPTVLNFLEKIGPYKISEVYLELNCKIGKSEKDSSLFHLILQASGLGNLLAGARILNGLRIEKADPTLAKDILERKIVYGKELLNAREILYRIWSRAKKKWKSV